MAASIIEHLDGTSSVVVPWETGDHHTFGLVETNATMELDQFDHEPFLCNMVFNYALLGAPNASDEKTPEELDSGDEDLQFPL